MASIPVPRQVAPAADWFSQSIEIGERVFALALLSLLAAPILACAAVLGILSRRTPLIAHRRVGWRGATLWMFKLRTMWSGEGPASTESTTSLWVEYIEDVNGPELKQDRDPRVSNWFARFCRRHSIDELPQLWHVIRGEMSLVGPRPVTDTEMRRYYDSDAMEVLQVKPGIAGLWQTSGRNRLTYAERRALDLEFVRHRSPRMYLRILLRTLPEVWSGSNSW